MNYEQEEEFLTNDLSRKLAQVSGCRQFCLHTLMNTPHLSLLMSGHARGCSVEH